MCKVNACPTPYVQQIVAAAAKLAQQGGGGKSLNVNDMAANSFEAVDMANVDFMQQIEFLHEVAMLAATALKPQLVAEYYKVGKTCG